MEVIGAVASTFQVVGQCGQISLQIARWYAQVKTVDVRIESFKQEVDHLRATYENLNKSLKNPALLEAARAANKDVGGHLWDQMGQTLQDCEVTVLAIANVLQKIDTKATLFKPAIKHLRESLYSGDLSRLREKVLLYNSSLQLPLQMMTLSQQLNQQVVTHANQLEITRQLEALKSSIETVSRRLTGPSRQETMATETTLIATASEDRTYVNHMRSYLNSAEKFLQSASHAATTLSAGSMHRGDSIATPFARRGSAWTPLTQEKRDDIASFVERVPTEFIAPAHVHAEPPPLLDPTLEQITMGDIEPDDDFDLTLLKELLQNGHKDVAATNYGSAEDNYREALTIANTHDFSIETGCTPSDITLLLAESCMKQDKLDETIRLLEPLSELSMHDMSQDSAVPTFSSSKTSDEHGQALAASYMLGQVYLKKNDFVNAENHAMTAYKGRRKLLGADHERSYESVESLIAIYKTSGRSAKAKGLEVFLKGKDSTSSQHIQVYNPASSQQVLSSTPSHEAKLVQEIPTEKGRRPTFSGGIFKRSEKVPDAPKTNIGQSDVFLSPDFGRSDAQRTSISCEMSPIQVSPKLTPQALHTRNESSASSSQARSASQVMASPPLTAWKSRQSTSSSRVLSFSHNMNRLELEQVFTSIAELCKNGKTSKAVDQGIKFLRQYDHDESIFLHRLDDLRENIKKSKSKGLAGTGQGQGYSPLHFFCALKYEPMIEVSILLDQGADVHAIAYKPGMGKANPFTPLTISVDRNHENLVRLLLDNGASWRTEDMKNSRLGDKSVMHPLLVACQRGYTGIVQLFLERHFTLEESDFPRSSWHGNSLLHEAAFYCYSDLIVMLTQFMRHNELLDHRAYNFIGHPGQKDAFGRTPLMYAVDLQDNDQRLRMHKLQTRVSCLRIMLEQHTGSPTPEVHELDDGVIVHRPLQRSSSRLTTDLYSEDIKGNTVFSYAQEAKGGDEELRMYLEEIGRQSRLIDV